MVSRWEIFMKKKRYIKFGRSLNQIQVLHFFIYLITVIIAGRLFWLQVIKYDFYQQAAAKEHYGYTELPARRGEIFIQDYASGETIRVATNVTLDTLFADPYTIIHPKKDIELNIEGPKIVADRIAPLIYDLAEARTQDQARMEEEKKQATTPEQIDKIKPLTDEELYKKFHDDLLAKISQDVRTSLILSNMLDSKVLAEIAKAQLPGIEVIGKELKAYPQKITNPKWVASALSKYLDMTSKDLEDTLKGKNRYVILKKKLRPESSAQIQKLLDGDKDKLFTGIGLQEEYYRFYPEGPLAANVLGYVNNQDQGINGIENAFDIQLRGKAGSFTTQKDGSRYGRQLTVGDSEIQPAVDGDSVVLTIDRSMQTSIEKFLEKGVKNTQADSGQVIVMDPKTGKIMALAHYPSFDPNNFGNALETEEQTLTPEEIQGLVPIENQPDNFWFYPNEGKENRYEIMREKTATGNYIYNRYKNLIGMEAYQNKVVSLPYEPGSIFKPITMSAALDDGDVKPNTSFYDDGELEFNDNFPPIRNVATAQCSGPMTMTRILEYSCNTGISWVVKKMGKNLFYNYVLKFGFGERTGIEFNNEHSGQIEHFTRWTDREMSTHAFGQGITVTPLQMVSAFAVLANKGVLMQPHIVEKVIENNGHEVQTEPVAIQKVVSEETTHIITAMLTSAVENGVAHKTQLEHHYLAAKTGTAQTYKHGKPLEGAGTTITSVAGYGPIEDPKFVILVKLDRPKTSPWADETAIFVFKDTAEYLYDYFGIPPDKNL